MKTAAALWYVDENTFTAWFYHCPYSIPAHYQNACQLIDVFIPYYSSMPSFLHSSLWFIINVVNQMVTKACRQRFQFYWSGEVKEYQYIKTILINDTSDVITGGYDEPGNEAMEDKMNSYSLDVLCGVCYILMSEINTMHMYII